MPEIALHPHLLGLRLFADFPKEDRKQTAAALDSVRRK
jgi:hypothetical protein